jgi:hypothetical protein
MRKPFAFLAMLALAGVASNAIAATVQQCNSRNNTCFRICTQRYPAGTAEINCGSRCIDRYTNCLRTATGGPPSNIQRGPNAVVTTSKSSRGSVPIQTGPNVVINQTPPRSGAPCTVGGRRK